MKAAGVRLFQTDTRVVLYGVRDNKIIFYNNNNNNKRKVIPHLQLKAK